MCSVSNTGDFYQKKWQDGWPYPSIPNPLNPIPFQTIPGIQPFNPPTREEFDALRREVEEMKVALLAAKKYDEQTGQADCEMDEKILILKKVAKLAGISLEEVFGKNK